MQPHSVCRQGTPAPPATTLSPGPAARIPYRTGWSVLISRARDQPSDNARTNDTTTPCCNPTYPDAHTALHILSLKDTNQLAEPIPELRPLCNSGRDKAKETKAA